MALDSIGKEQKTAAPTSSRLEELLYREKDPAFVKRVVASQEWKNHAKTHQGARVVSVDTNEKPQREAQEQLLKTAPKTQRQAGAVEEEENSPKPPTHTVHDTVASGGGEYLTGKPFPVTCSCGTQIDVKIPDLSVQKLSREVALYKTTPTAPKEIPGVNEGLQPVYSPSAPGEEKKKGKNLYQPA